MDHPEEERGEPMLTVADTKDEERARWKKLFGRYSTEKIKRFAQFHKNNPDVYIQFAELARQMKASGRKRYSAETIVNVLRWHTDLKTEGEEFKISNDFRSMYARLFVFRNPEFEGFFSMKGLEDEGEHV